MSEQAEGLGEQDQPKNPKSQWKRRLGITGGLLVVGFILLVVFVPSDESPSYTPSARQESHPAGEWATALKNGGQFDGEQWDGETCRTIEAFLSDGYRSAWWSDQADDVQVSKQGLDGRTPEGYAIVPILGTALRHCRG